MQTRCHWPANIYFFFLASKIGRPLWLLGRLVNWFLGWLVGWLAGWLVGWLIGWLVGWRCFCPFLAFISHNYWRRHEERTKHQPTIKSASRSFSFNSRTGTKINELATISMLFFVFPEQVTQNRNDWTMRKRIAWLKQNPNVVQERLTLNLNGKKHQHCLIVLQRISRGKSKCLPFVVGIPLKLNKNIPHFSFTVLNANRRTFFLTRFKENTQLHLWQNHRAWTSHPLFFNKIVHYCTMIIQLSSVRQSRVEISPNSLIKEQLSTSLPNNQ